ncbi:hypothetical protein KAK07_02860 [Ideonella sp. 4Y16]|uniref:hypothetical protein n=1 Tax=Ideonella alba TaxID=2824118 RepID=UPI001B364CE9|nr:hypothetical protein [Ideonella alba]MBQ0942271.1 hypothetical protein [Ideonella alba]
MNLTDIAQGHAPPVALAAIGGHRALAMEVQQRLSAAGLLEPPPDGLFGRVSFWALNEVMARLGLSDTLSLDRTLSQALLSPDLAALYPLTPDGGAASRIVAAMQRRGWWLTRHPGCVNIVYVEGADAQFQPNGNRPNWFNDQRVVIQVNATGVPVITGQWVGTTEPGRYYTEVMQADPRGAARIAFGQYKSWRVGMHPQSKPDKAHEALVQVDDITVCRDLNQDYRRDGDARYTGLFGINQHAGFDMSVDNIGNASAGCLLGRSRQGHREFMALIKADPRYQADKGFRFMTAVLPVADLHT